MTVYKPEEYIKKNLQSSIRNEKIAKLLFLSKSIEQFGSGFKRINSLCKDAKIKFSYETDESGFTFIVHRKKVTAPVQTADAVTVNVTENVTLNKMEKLVYQLSVAGLCGAFYILRLQELLIEFFMTRINMKKQDNNCNKITTIRPL